MPDTNGRIANSRQRALLQVLAEFNVERKPWLLVDAANCYSQAARMVLMRDERARLVRESGTTETGEILATAEDQATKIEADPVGSYYGRRDDKRVNTPSGMHWPFSDDQWDPQNDAAANLTSAGALIDLAVYICTTSRHVPSAAST